jgi:hypothetical protein
MVNANIATNILKRTKTYINKAKSTSASIFRYPETTSYAKSIRTQSESTLGYLD